MSQLLSSLLSARCEGVCSHDSCVLGAIRGFRNGVVYGARIRFPHALVMTFLFHHGTLRQKVEGIAKATYMHARNLGCFVFIFKAVRCLLRHYRNKETPLNSFLAGLAGGAVMWSQNNPVNSQINMYILSRIIMGLTNTAVQNKFIPNVPGGFSIYGSVIWGIVMWLFFYHRESLQKSLQSSMQYLYEDSDTFPEGCDSIVDWFLR